jgi:hypothetical protein
VAATITCPTGVERSPTVDDFAAPIALVARAPAAIAAIAAIAAARTPARLIRIAIRVRTTAPSLAVVR